MYNQKTAQRRAEALSDAEHDTGLDYNHGENYQNDVQHMAARGAQRSYEPQNWAEEDFYWRNEFKNRPYTVRTARYTLYQPAYRYGMLLQENNPDSNFDELSDSDMESGWEENRQDSELSWQAVRDAARDSFQRNQNKNMNKEEK